MFPEIKKFAREKAPLLAIMIKTMRHLIRPHLSKGQIRRLLREGKEIYLELGAGGKKGELGWTTIDVTKKCDIYWDLRKGIPFPDECVTKIYSSHFLEHLPFRKGQKFLDECLRVLVPGGSFSISVPNARIFIDAYIKSETLEKNPFFGYEPAFNNTTNIDYVNYIAYMDGHHKYMFDEKNLIFILESKGFKNVHLREFDPGLDVKEREPISIFAEGQK